MNIKEFLQANEIDYTLYKLKATKLLDVLIHDREITQTVKTDIVQFREEYEDWLEENKKEIPRGYLFKKNDLNIGTFNLKGIEPGTLTFDDCITCNGHGSIMCNGCNGKGEVKCPKCGGKTYILNSTKKTRQESVTCTGCNGVGQSEIGCRGCNGTGQISYTDKCRSCFGKGQIFNPQFNQYQPCQQCSGQGGIVQTKSCHNCNGRGQITLTCKTCGGKGSFLKNVEYVDEKTIPCGYCKEEGRVTCPKCKGAQEVTCGTCGGGRKTYQAKMNYFTVGIKPKETLLALSLPQKGIDCISLDKHFEVKKISTEEKKKLSDYKVQKSFDLTKTSISRVDGILYALESIETKNIYYIYYSNLSKNYIFSSLPPKNRFEDLVDKYLNYIGAFFVSFFNKIKKIKDKLLNRREY